MAAEENGHRVAAFVTVRTEAKYLTNRGWALSSVHIKSLSWPLNLHSKQTLGFKMIVHYKSCAANETTTNYCQNMPRNEQTVPLAD
jgi:hypothetical protein